MNLFKDITIADVFTLGNAISGFLSILFSIYRDYGLSIVFLLIAVGFDVLDGKIARLYYQGKFGKDLDSLADIVSFGVAPAIFGIMHVRTVFGIIASIFFVLSGILRLARFNVSENKTVYQGMPITFNGLIVPLIYITKLPVVFYPFVYLVSGVLMISSFKLKKIF